jgi:hypothetical protein
MSNYMPAFRTIEIINCVKNTHFRSDKYNDQEWFWSLKLIKRKIIMATALEKIRAKLVQENTLRNTNQQSNEPTATYRHWNQTEDSIIRFLPDADDENECFWVTRQIHEIPFINDKGFEFKVRLPRNRLILEHFRDHWDGTPDERDLARKYYVKRSGLMQGFVTVNGLHEELPDGFNPIRQFVITPQVLNCIKAGLADPDLVNLPTDYVGGLDFRLVKTSRGEYADWSTSKFSRKESDLTPEQLAAIDRFGLVDLKTRLPKPVDEQLAYECMLSSLNGHKFDEVKFGLLLK